MEVHSQNMDDKLSLDVSVSYYRFSMGFLKKYAQGSLFYIKSAALTLFLLYFAVPVFVKSNQWIMPKLVFSNILKWPPFINLSAPEDFGINNTKSFFLHVEEGVDIGVWHVLPEDVCREKDNIPLEGYEETLYLNGNPVVLYLHGNTGTRGSHHRVQLLKLLQKLDFHVITIDYRGFGDSSGSPTEDGVVADSYYTYKWLKERMGSNQLYVWGHSLGTGIATKLTKRLSEEGDEPTGLVLESPFNNIREATRNHPFSKMYRWHPWFDWVVIEAVYNHGIYFRSDQNIASVTTNILIMHAKDDPIVPYHLGTKLCISARESRTSNTGDVEFISFEKHHGYGHIKLYKAPELPMIIRNFVSKSDLRVQDKTSVILDEELHDG